MGFFFRDRMPKKNPDFLNVVKMKKKRPKKIQKKNPKINQENPLFGFFGFFKKQIQI